MPSAKGSFKCRPEERRACSPKADEGSQFAPNATRTRSSFRREALHDPRRRRDAAGHRPARRDQRRGPTVTDTSRRQRNHWWARWIRRNWRCRIVHRRKHNGHLGGLSSNNLDAGRIDLLTADEYGQRISSRFQPTKRRLRSRRCSRRDQRGKRIEILTIGVDTDRCSVRNLAPVRCRNRDDRGSR